MSQENVEVVQRAIAALNERDVDGYLALCAADIELVSPVAPIEGASTGEQGIRDFFSGLDEATSAFRLDVERIEAIDAHRVLALVSVIMESQGGVFLNQPAANIYEVVDGKLRRVRVYLNRDDALEAAGLRE